MTNSCSIDLGFVQKDFNHYYTHWNYRILESMDLLNLLLTLQRLSVLILKVSVIITVWCDDTDESENAVGWFLSWSENNSMHSNSKKCKELTFRKKGIRKSWN